MMNAGEKFNRNTLIFSVKKAEWFKRNTEIDLGKD